MNGFKKSMSSAMLTLNKTVVNLLLQKQTFAILAPSLSSSDWSKALKLILMSRTACKS